MTTTSEQTRAIIRWGHQHRRMLRTRYRRQFVAYSATRLLAAGRDWDLVESLATATGEPFLVKWIPAQTSEFQFFWFKFYGMARHEWEPEYPVTLSHGSVSHDALMLVDSGAELSLISLEIGELLGFALADGEILSDGTGVGGEIQYVTRAVDFTINGHSFKAPVAWLQTEITDAPLLLGREVVFDLFNIEFIQAEERIEFKWRGTSE
ncbi:MULTISPECIES: retropepsin-like aspartic protease [unclassified Chamaesiphon]|uniref:retropepsin-like aspartic protease n=1 Tax=unclassified Chamaesiphon TaxID=2620921 RepID=UPI00286B0C0F|nr:MULTISPECIES: retropepsin-like aspartic protease [unclassified Chamaesiphon]